MFYTWDNVKLMLDVLGYHKKIRIEFTEISFPDSSMGFVETMGEPEFQLKDYRKRVNGTECMHVQVFKDYFAVHRDKVDPDLDPAGHLIEDAPEIPIALLAGGIIGFVAGTDHYDKVKDTSDHPVLESVLLGLTEGGAVAGLVYLLGKLVREQLE